MHLEGDVGPVVVRLHAFGDDAVEREGLVEPHVMRGSNTRPGVRPMRVRRDGVTPLMMKGLRLSKEPIVPTSPGVIDPPFGASGST